MENLIPVDRVAPQPDAPVAPQAEDDNQSAIVRPLTPEGSRTAESDTAAPTTREGGAGAPEGVAPVLDSAGVVGAAATATATGGLVGDVVPHVDAAVVGAVAPAGEDNGGWAWDASTQAWVPALAGGSGAPLALVDYDTTAAAIHAEDGSVAQPAADAATAVERALRRRISVPVRVVWDCFTAPGPVALRLCVAHSDCVPCAARIAHTYTHTYTHTSTHTNTHIHTVSHYHSLTPHAHLQGLTR
jgi:hypothetical protein